MSVSQPVEPLAGREAERPMRALLAGLLPGEGWVLGEWLRDVLPQGTLELVEVEAEAVTG